MKSRYSPKQMRLYPKTTKKTFILKVNPTKRVKILFVDTQRYEFKFIRRALEDDPNIVLTVRYVTSEQSFGGTQDRLAQKFTFYPDSKEVLFDYDAIIIGNLPASEFTQTQLENTVEFVRTRGGGFLMLGGDRFIR